MQRLHKAFQVPAKVPPQSLPTLMCPKVRDVLACEASAFFPCTPENQLSHLIRKHITHVSKI